jgi:hypothetical protein
MGYRLYREVKLNAPAGWSKAARLVAWAIADDANDDTRRSWIKQDELMRQTGIETPGGLRKVLRELADSGYEFRVPISVGSDGRMLFACHGRSTDFLIPEMKPPTDEMTSAPAPEHEGGPNGSPSDVGVTPLPVDNPDDLPAPDPVDNPEIGPKAVHLDPKGGPFRPPLPSQHPLISSSNAVGNSTSVSAPVDPAIASKDKTLAAFRRGQLASSRADVPDCQPCARNSRDMCMRCGTYDHRRDECPHIEHPPIPQSPDADPPYVRAAIEQEPSPLDRFGPPTDRDRGHLKQPAPLAAALGTLAAGWDIRGAA